LSRTTVTCKKYEHRCLGKGNGAQRSGPAPVIREGGLKATSKGNLPLKFCESMAQGLQKAADNRRSLRIGGIRTETDLEQLHCTRMVAKLEGLIRKYRGHFLLTRKCQDMLSRQDHEGPLFQAVNVVYHRL
tara:strand:+ start:1979 stop:2371 length:393 start_codon:yes stop_codon:yes gene_type:complete